MRDELSTLANDAKPVRRPLKGSSFPIVGIGASAGGLEAFTNLLHALPLDTGMAFVLVQHLSPTHDSALAEILSRATRMPVTEVHDEPAVEANHVYVIPPNRCMGITGGVLQLAPREKAGLRVVDHFFRTLAEDRRHQAVGVVLSGTGNDGTLGLETIKAEGGITFAQDDTALHDGMPHSAIAAGCVDLVLPVDQIANELVRIARHPYAVPEFISRERDSEPKLARVLQILHRATGVDFGQYKFNTLYRRVTRRMVLQGLADLSDYAGFLQSNEGETQALYSDILINVTSFFRNPQAYEVLKEKVFPHLLDNRARQEPVRIWTLGCSTGQEAYSVAMAFVEYAEDHGSQVGLQLFATDLNATSVDVARAGTYSKDIAQDVSPERLRRFFVEVDGHYRIAKSIRDACVFSRHNMLADPPFSRMDLVTCRNLLIYLEPALQQKVVPTLHYALKPTGYLWLGTSETIGGFRNLFEPLDTKQKIYAKKPGPQGAHTPLHQSAAPRAAFAPVTARASIAAMELHREADRLLLTRFAPPSVLVSAELDILQFRGDTSPFLAPAPGKASLSLTKMLREGLLVGVRAALQRASQSGQTTREEGLRVRSHDGWRELAIEVVPLKGSEGKDGNANDGGFLLLFDESGSPATHAKATSAAASARPSDDAHQEDARLAHELAATREYLQSVIEQQEAANEELQSSSEEIQSANEELQSINEELETSKEEIQSSNEELVTVNDELNSRNAELNRLNNDLVNVFGSVQMPIVLVGPDLRVRRFTPAAEKHLNLMPVDIGRPLAHIKLGLPDLPDLEPLLREVLDTVSNREIESRDSRGNRYVVRLRPYRTLDNKIDGVVVMFIDIELLKRAQEYAESIVATVREPLLVLNADLRVQTASQSFYRHFHVARGDTEGRLLHELGGGEWNIPELRGRLAQVLLDDSRFDDYEVSHEFKLIGKRTMRLNARRLLQLDDHGQTMILLAIEDVTDRKRAEVAVAQLAAIVASSKDAIISKDLDGVITSWNLGAQELFGYSAEEVIGKSVTLLIPADQEDEEPAILARIRRGEAIEHYQTVRRRKDGSLLDVSLTVSPIKDASGRIVGASKVARDITKQRELAEQVFRSATELAEVDRHKNEFLAMLAHELRNPLGPIRNALHIIRLAGGNGETMHSATQVMERQVAQMVRLVDDLLDVSRISRGKIEVRRTPTDLVSVVRQAVETARPACQTQGLELTVSLPNQPLVLNADPTRLIQVVGNLLNNACKFSDSGGRVWLNVERDGDLAVIRVGDNGIGITAEALPRIFGMFVQADTSLERSSSGLGIGLSLVKSVVEMHGGTVEAKSAGVGLGSEFVVRLPIDGGVDAPVAQPNVDEPATTAGRRVLVVDDNHDAAESLAQLLQLRGHETRVAHNGIRALELADAFRPDLVLLDIGMPKMNGYDAARRIREQPWGRDMALVALTGWGQDDDRQKSSRAGFDAHLVKPVQASTLTELIAKLPARQEQPPAAA